MTDLEYALKRIGQIFDVSDDIKDDALGLVAKITNYESILLGVHASLEIEMKKRNNPWIPVDERLPETDEPVLVTYKDDSDEAKVGWDYYMDGFWHASPFRTIIAWMPLPKAYEG